MGNADWFTQSFAPAKSSSLISPILHPFLQHEWEHWLLMITQCSHILGNSNRLLYSLSTSFCTLPLSHALSTTHTTFSLPSISCYPSAVPFITLSISIDMVTAALTHHQPQTIVDTCDNSASLLVIGCKTNWIIDCAAQLNDRISCKLIHLALWGHPKQL